MSYPTIKCGVSEMPVVGLGTWQSKPGVVGAAVETALSVGYKHIDCAHVYQNEAEIGESFAKMFGEGGIKREEIFITSKLWNTFHRADEVEAACDTTLKNLQLEYLDLYLIHWPVALEPGKGTLFPVDDDKVSMMDTKSPSFAETWGALEKLVESGKCKNIGLSNFNIAQIEEVLGCAKIKPANLQVESHAHLPNLELLDFCKKHGMSFVAYSPLGNPGSVFRKEDQVDLLHEEEVLKIGQKHGVTAGQVLIRYQVEKGNAVIPKSVTPSRIEENLNVFGFSLDAADMETLNNLYKKAGPKGYRTCNVLHWQNSPNYPFTSELYINHFRMSISTITCGVSQMPVVGFGTSKTSDPQAAVEMALNTGYRHIDCAHVYRNEVEIGRAFSKTFATGDIQREEVFITGKLWSTSHRGSHVEPACDKTLSDLQLHYLDLYLIHWPVAFEPGKGSLNPMDDNNVRLMDTQSPSLSETWTAMEKLVESGKCKNIGLSNFNIQQIKEVLKNATIKPACLQVESHPLFPNLELLEFCKNNDIAFVSYSPLGAPGRSWKKEDQLDLLNDEDVLKIALKHDVTAGQVLIRYQVDKGNAVIPKSSSQSRITENFNVLGFSLDSTDMGCLNKLHKKAGPYGYRVYLCPDFKHSPLYPFPSEI
ncbi:uncharacterized protein LOC134813272 [Bolinopsis microptera]|uniref:uncharacterized protein LOC134813272 n=1 Tax=Bolinopsis microptera TaxID=2820187 RepID=UPI00307AB049